MENNNAQAVIAALQANGGEYIDDHNRNTDKVSTADWFGIYKSNENEYAFIGFNRVPFCINKCYIDDQGRVHVHTSSVGGNVHMHLFANVADGVEDFNNRAKGNILGYDISIPSFHVNKAA